MIRFSLKKLSTLSAPLKLLFLVAALLGAQLSNAHHEASLAHEQDVCEICVQGGLTLAVAPELHAALLLPDSVTAEPLAQRSAITAHVSCYFSRAPPIVLN